MKTKIRIIPLILLAKHLNEGKFNKDYSDLIENMNKENAKDKYFECLPFVPGEMPKLFKQ